MKYTSQSTVALQRICTFLNLDKTMAIHEIVSNIKTDDIDLELYTLQLIRDKIIYNKYFVLDSESYKQCKQICSKNIIK